MVVVDFWGGVSLGYLPRDTQQTGQEITGGPLENRPTTGSLLGVGVGRWSADVDVGVGKGVRLRLTHPQVRHSTTTGEVRASH